jgi:hypothetical protein
MQAQHICVPIDLQLNTALNQCGFELPKTLHDNAELSLQQVGRVSSCALSSALVSAFLAAARSLWTLRTLVCNARQVASMVAHPNNVYELSGAAGEGTWQRPLCLAGRVLRKASGKGDIGLEVKTLTGKVIQVTADYGETVRDIKADIQESEGWCSPHELTDSTHFAASGDFSRVV